MMHAKGWLLAGCLLLLLPGPVFSAGEEAPTIPRETVCLQCHGGMEGRLGAPVGLWKQSIHRQNGISCHDCHGGDPTDFAMAMSPERGFRGAPEKAEIPAFCGRCHIGVKDDYLASKHGRALGKGGPQCVTCHGNHAVVKASPDLINDKDCTRCHSFERAARIKAALTDTDRIISGLERDLADLRRLGIAVKKMRGEVFAKRNEFHRLFHTVDVNKVHQGTAAVQKSLGEVATEVAGIRSDLSQRKLWGGIAIVLLLVAGGLCLLLRRTYHDEEGKG
ncbi:multiheme c-type cytochrome [Geothermobacter hydrogeniphilus]|uniref:multiheme c-type cytochrome n=1 Tax=Geothermobacter hydrogeniphilus TaxID=1969733 RepID=UPI0011AF54D1|nr:multiheme c-type cytochrome [Geothermobacter hydrogeniphilus]